jgi:hypothetical protein
VGKTVDSEASADVATDIMPATTISAMRMGRLGPQDTFINILHLLCHRCGYEVSAGLADFWHLIGGMLSVDYEFMNTYSQQSRRRGGGKLVFGVAARCNAAKSRAAERHPGVSSSSLAETVGQ